MAHNSYTYIKNIHNLQQKDNSITTLAHENTNLNHLFSSTMYYSLFMYIYMQLIPNYDDIFNIIIYIALLHNWFSNTNINFYTWSVDEPEFHWKLKAL